MKKIAALLVCIYIFAHLSACTSKESREDEATAPAEETAAVDSELEKVEGSDTAAAGTTDEANAGFVDEQLPDQALGEQNKTEGSTTDTATPPADENALDTTTNQASGEAPPPEVAPPTETEAAPPAETSAGIDPGTETSAPAPEVAAAPTETPANDTPKPSLKKIKDAPFHEGGQLLNAVFIARPGDNYKKIAQTIYGDSARKKDLMAANPAISTVHAGDKIYYNSPQRPTDDTAMRTYYEDMGAQPEVYITKEGDNLKKIGKNLLGYSQGWKELWVSNKDLDSKGDLAPGTEIKYWKEVPQGAAIAKTDTPPDMAPTAPADNSVPPPTTAQNSPPPDLPPPPPADASAMGTTTADMPPPPPPAEMAPPPPPIEQAPPPPPPAAKPKMMPQQAEGFSNDDMMLGLGAVGILAAGVAAIMVIRKRRQQKEMAAAFGDTQVGAS